MAGWVFSIFSLYIGLMIMGNPELKPGLDDQGEPHVYPEHESFYSQVYFVQDLLWYGKVVKMTQIEAVWYFISGSIVLIFD